MAAANSPFQRRYPPEMRERAVRMVREAIAESGERVGAVTRVARQLGIGPESLRNWVKQAEIDSGKRPGVTSAEQRRIAELEREVRELRRANEILRDASAFFARELDPRPTSRSALAAGAGQRDAVRRAPLGSPGGGRGAGTDRLDVPARLGAGRSRLRSRPPQRGSGAAGRAPGHQPPVRSRAGALAGPGGDPRPGAPALPPLSSLAPSWAVRWPGAPTS